MTPSSLRTLLPDSDETAEFSPGPLAMREAGAGRLDALYVLNNLAIGGSERKTLRAANGLVARGAKLGLVCLNRPDTLLGEVDRRIPVWFLDRGGKFSPAAAARLRRIAALTQARTLIAVNLYPALYIAATAPFLPAHTRTVCLINTSAEAVSLNWRLRRMLYKLMLRGFDLAVHGCEAYRKLWATPGGRAWQRSSVLYNGVDLAQFEPSALTGAREQTRARLGIGGGSFVFGTVGRLVPGKNQGALIEALAHMRASGMDAHVLIAGDGPLRDSLTQQAEALGIGACVTFTGALSDVRPVLAAMDVFVLPSVGIETFSNAVLEAMAMAKPVIVSGIGGAGEMVSEGVEGFIVDPAELPQRLPTLLAALLADPLRRHGMGNAARARVQRQFSLAGFLDAHQALIAAQDRIHAG